jgi:hypothetical protein
VRGDDTTSCGSIRYGLAWITIVMNMGEQSLFHPRQTVSQLNYRLSQHITALTTDQVAVHVPGDPMCHYRSMSYLLLRAHGQCGQCSCTCDSNYNPDNGEHLLTVKSQSFGSPTRDKDRGSIGGHDCQLLPSREMKKL